MIWPIIKKEIQENLTTYRFYVLSGLLLLLIIVSIVVSYGDYELRLENYNLNRPTANSSNVMIPPAAISIFAKGVDAHLGRLYYITVRGIEVQDIEQSVNRLFLLFTVPDMLFIIKVMLSLIALLFGFDAITGERENGTLKLALASGSNRVALLFGKLLGRFTLVALPFSFLFLAAAVVVSLLPDIRADAGYWQRILFFLLAANLYIFLFGALAILVSSLVQRSTAAMTLCISVWVLFIFVVPQFGMALARAASDVPPGDRIDMEQRLASVQAIYERIHEDKSWTGSGSERMARQIRDANDRILASYRPQLNNLIAVTKEIGRVSPGGALTFLLTDAGNTGIYEELRYKDAIAMYAQRNFDYINNIRQGTMEDFHYERSSLGEVLSGPAMADLLVLILFSILFVAASMMSFLNYDPR